MTRVNRDTNAAKRRPSFGLWALLIKLGPKLVSVLVKMTKGLKVGKFAFAAASFGGYAAIFNWKFAVVLMGSIFVHEYGHVWAMRRYGMPVKGIYFLPFLGAAAVTEGSFPSRKAETVIALMGPIWGLALALATAGVYVATGSPIAAALAAWMGMVNLFNLLPINPLDGGRVMKSVAYSISSRAGAAFLVIGLVACFVLAFAFNLGLMAFLLLIGSAELVGQIKEMRRERDRIAITRALAQAFGCAATPDAVIAAIERASTRQQEKISLWAREERACGTDVPDVVESPWTDRILLARTVEEIGAAARKEHRTLILRRPDFSTRSIDLLVGFPVKDSPFGKFLSQRAVPSMTGRECLAGFAGYVLLAAALVALMASMGHVPGADAALKVFAD